MPEGAKRRREGENIFRRGNYIWLKDDVHVYLPALVLETYTKGGEGKVRVRVLESEDETVLTREQQQQSTYMHEESAHNFDDLLRLEHLDEASILHNLRTRFKNNQVYTNIGNILVSVNPFKALPTYSPQIIQDFLESGFRNQGPHVFGLADRIYADLVERNRNQSCVISGDSGSGKTEATKLILQYLSEKSGPPVRSKKEKSIEAKILEAGPLLEAFGNAKTQQNTNSSRFGKLIQVHFDGTGTIVGGEITEYLLEKSRIVKQAETERNYHVFYQLCAAAKSIKHVNLLAKLKDAEHYHYLNQSKEPSTEVEGIDDTAGWEHTAEAMRILGIEKSYQNEIFFVIAAIVHLGNISFEAHESHGDAAKLVNRDELEICAGQLGVDPNALEELMLRQKLGVKTSVVFHNYTAEQAKGARDAIAQMLYVLVFEWLIGFVNHSLRKHKVDQSRTISVLDIFGFENFQINSFEQLCINYCNEKLQASFNYHVFQQEKEVMAAEGVQPVDVIHSDNTMVLAALEDSRTGLFALLDEESKLPNGSDENYLRRVLAMKSNVVQQPSIREMRKDAQAQLSFTVSHYAGEVSYVVSHFVDKNRENPMWELSRLMSGSRQKFVAKLFSKARRSSKEGVQRKVSVGGRFKEQLAQLDATLNTTELHYLRCIKPNDHQQSGVFTSPLVLRQMNSCGLLEVCRIRKSGFPNRLSFNEFVHRYACLVKHTPFSSIEQLCKQLTQASLLGSYLLGKSKVFLQADEHWRLEAARDKVLSKEVRKIQALVRGYQQRKKYEKGRRLLNALKAAVRKKNQRKVEAIVADRSILPYSGEFNPVVRSALRYLSSVQMEGEVLHKMEQAVERQDRSMLTSVLYTADALQLTDSVGAARQLQQSLAIEEQPEVEAIKAEMELAQTFSGSADGIHEDHLNRLAVAMNNLEALGRHRELLSKAKRLERRLKEQLRAQKMVATALHRKQGMKQALMKAKEAGLKTDAMHQLEAAIAFRKAKTTRRIHLETGGEKRLSNIADMSKSITKIRRESKVQDNLPLSQFFKLRKDADFPHRRSKLRGNRLVAHYEPLSRSLLVLGGNLNRIAVLLNKAILQYCGDLPFVEKQRPNVATYILTTALEVPALCDEVYIQLCRHLTHNTRSTSESRAWLLMTLATQLFTPSKDFFPYLQRFLISLQQRPLLLGNFARLSLVQLENTKELGPATSIPDIEVVASYSLRPPVLAKIHAIGKRNSDIVVAVYPDYDVDNVLKVACKYCNIEQDRKHLFGLFVHKMRPKDTSRLRQRLINFYKKWERSKLADVDYFTAVWAGRENELFKVLREKYGPEPKVARKQMTNARVEEEGGELNLPCPQPWWTHVGDLFLEMASKGIEPVFTLRRRLIDKREAPSEELVHHLAQNLHLEELVVDDQDELVTLMALLVVLKWNKPPSSVESVAQGLREFLPRHLISRRKDLAQFVLDRATKLTSNRQILKAQLVDVCSGLITYGMCFFPVRHEAKDKRGVVCGVDINGVHLLTEKRDKVLYTYKFSQVTQYGATQSNFWMNVRKGGNESRVIEVSINTEQAWALYSLIYDFTKSSKRGEVIRERRNYTRTSILTFVA